MALTERRLLLVRAPLALLLGGEGSIPASLLRQPYTTIGAALELTLSLCIEEHGTDKIEGGAGKMPWRTTKCIGWRETWEGIEHALRYFGLDRRLRLSLWTEVPADAGLALHAAALVAAVKGLALWSGLALNPPQIAALAVEVARSRGRGQERTLPLLYASAFGGVYRLSRQSARKGSFEVQPVEGVEPGLLSEMSWLVLPERAVEHPIAPLWQDIAAAERRHRRTAELLEKIVAAWADGAGRELALLLDAVGGLQEAAFVDPPVLGEAYRLAYRAGAWGGFPIQDGVGSALLLFVPPEGREAVQQVLRSVPVIVKHLSFAAQPPVAFSVEPWRRRRYVHAGLFADAGKKK